MSQRNNKTGSYLHSLSSRSLIWRSGTFSRYTINSIVVVDAGSKAEGLVVGDTGDAGGVKQGRPGRHLLVGFAVGCNVLGAALGVNVDVGGARGALT